MSLNREHASGEMLAAWLDRHVLPLVEKPARYCGGGWGETADHLATDWAVLLAFPDVYEIGVGHLGLEILKDALRDAGIRVERTYCPWPDMESLMRRHRVNLYSLESFTPADRFDVLGVTIQHELAFTNILTLIDLAGVPLLQSNRHDGDLYVVGGGPGTGNPEPMADFFDLFLIGDGEEAFPPLAKLLATGRRRGRPRIDVLREAARLPGVYVPSLYRARTTDAEGAWVLEPCGEGIPDRIEATRMWALPSGAPLPSVPLVVPTQDRYPVEIMRGCPRRCRFCQARVYYGTPRLRTPCEIAGIADQVVSSGWDEIALLSLSSGDYPRLPGLVASLQERLGPHRIGLSLPSLRAEGVSDDLCRELSRSRARGLTLAPEAGTERLRAAIGKELSDADLLQALAHAFSHGWTNAKLYFMVGLPGETEEDVDAIGRLVRRACDLARRHGGRRLGVTCSPFVPKPHTEFEREGMLDIATLESRQLRVRRMMPGRMVEYSWRNPRMSRWEAVLARGDRRLGPVILDGWRHGARFDEWESHFREEIWLQAARAHGLDLARVAGARDSAARLPWDHIVLSTRTPPPPRPIDADAGPIPVHPASEERGAARRMRLAYSKGGLRRFLSHLDVVRLWHLVLRRAHAGLIYSEGFSPRPRLAFGPALPVGIASSQEYLDFWTRRADSADLMRDIAAQCPAGIDVIDMREVPAHVPSLDSDIAFADYEVLYAEAPLADVPDLPQGATLLEATGARLRVRVHLRTRGAPKPRDLAACGGLDREAALLTTVRRLALWIERDGVLLSPLCAS